MGAPPAGPYSLSPPGLLWWLSLRNYGDIVEVSEVLWGDLAVRDSGQEFAKGAPALSSLKGQLDDFISNLVRAWAFAPGCSPCPCFHDLTVHYDIRE